MSDPLQRKLFLDDRLESYDSFFDHQWAKDFSALASTAAKLQEPAFDFLMSCKGISRTAALPNLSVALTESYAQGHDHHKLSVSESMRLIDHIVARIEQQVVLNSNQKTEVVAAMAELAEEFRRKLDAVNVEFPKQDLWDSCVKVVDGESPHSPKNEMRLALWASQRVCYSALYFAYEDLLTRCLSIHQRREVRAIGTSFQRVCRDALSPKLQQQCVFGRQINTAKLVRHALVHAGGRETAELKNSKHLITVVDGQLQILPQDVKELYSCLKWSSVQLLKWAVQQPEFQ